MDMPFVKKKKYGSGDQRKLSSYKQKDCAFLETFYAVKTAQRCAILTDTVLKHNFNALTHCLLYTFLRRLRDKKKNKEQKNEEKFF